IERLFVQKGVGAPREPLHRTRDLFLVLLAQGVVGYVQYFTDLPEILVGAHMLGSCLVWIATLRVLLSLRERPADEVDGADAPGPAVSETPVAARG
ncbi:heme A synthase, partial [Streptomyces sp. ND04-05B]|nr:heme A synthase [Streptomyces sp. ND04-05B]